MFITILDQFGKESKKEIEGDYFKIQEICKLQGWTLIKIEDNMRWLYEKI